MRAYKIARANSKALAKASSGAYNSTRRLKVRRKRQASQHHEIRLVYIIMLGATVVNCILNLKDQLSRRAHQRATWVPTEIGPS
jgi:hypothetical protein